MAQRPRISTEACDVADELVHAIDELGNAMKDVRDIAVEITADGEVSRDEFDRLLTALGVAEARGDLVEDLADEVDGLTDEVDMAIAISVATVRTGATGERRRRLLKEVSGPTIQVAA